MSREERVRRLESGASAGAGWSRVHAMRRIESSEKVQTGNRVKTRRLLRCRCRRFERALRTDGGASSSRRSGARPQGPVSSARDETRHLTQTAMPNECVSVSESSRGIRVDATVQQQGGQRKRRQWAVCRMRWPDGWIDVRQSRQRLCQRKSTFRAAVVVAWQ